MKKAAELVFIPSLGISHLVSTVEMAKLLVARDDRLFITVLIMKLPFDSEGTGVHTESVAASSMTDHIKFIDLPVPQQDIQAEGINPGIFLKLVVENYKPQVKDAVTKLITESNRAESNPRLAGFVIDMFCTTMIDVANEFGVPTYTFFASNTGFLGLMFYMQILHDEQNKDCTEFKDSGAELVLPSFVHRFPARSLPGLFLDKERAAEFRNYARRFRETKGILINTFMELESHALHSLCDGKTPPLYPVGPILNLKSHDDSHEASEQAKQKSEILGWLDDQPPSSVVFLCFGNMGSFGEDQVKEIAWGLERTGLRFLWSLRQPPSKGKFPLPIDYADPKGVLPKGFIDQTAGIGKVIGWAPQVVVLAHPAIGGFVSHCGWNSTLESIWYGVPIAAWPMYAEQQSNAFMLVEEFGLAVDVKMDYRKDSEVVVSAEEIEKGIRQVMEMDSDQRKKVKEMSEKSDKALMVGGSSHSSLGRFIDQLCI